MRDKMKLMKFISIFILLTCRETLEAPCPNLAITPTCFRRGQGKFDFINLIQF